MKLALLLPCLLIAQPSDAVRFRVGDAGHVEVMAALSEAQQKALPAGALAFEQGESWLRLSVLDPKSGKAGPPMLGNYHRHDAELRFRPRFGLEPGRHYRAFFGPTQGPTLTGDYRPPLRGGGAPARVVKIYPTSDVFPANLLRFYIYFSEPMRGGQQIFRQIDILDADGNVVDDPWLCDEIWDETEKCLILYIHPGRIKWGLVLREVLGPVLMPNRDYTLVLRGAIVDANGSSLGKDLTKKFHTTSEDRVRINLSDWHVDPPVRGSTDAVVVHFSKSIDHKSLERSLTIQGGDGHARRGTITIGKEEKTWSFTPVLPWENGEYQLVVNGRLEDVAGNTPLRPFDLDLEAPKLKEPKLHISFRPR